MEWPYRRFMRAFDAWQRRRAVERIERQEDLHIASMYANTNMDDDKNDRPKRVQELRDYYQTLKRHVFGETDDEVEEMDENQAAFMRASQRNAAQVVLPGESSIARLP